MTKSGQTTQFFYDASGQRVLTIQPNDTPNDTYIYTPFADYEEQYTPAVPTAVAAPTIHANTLPTNWQLGLLISVVTLLLVVTWRMRRRGILWSLLLFMLLLSMGRKPLQAQQYIVTTRVHYSIAGHLIGVRVVEQSATENAIVGTFYYTYTDHLGNVGALSDANGNYVSNSLALFRPFGEYRREPSTNPSITDRGYTGHAHNNSGTNDLGLIYMGARYFLPEAGRFVTADTLVPDPINPQALNRYSYVRNNPLNLIDPTGHCAMTPDGGQDPDDQECWDQFFGVYAYLRTQGYDNIAFLLGAGKDWELISDPDAYLSREGVRITLLDFLKIRRRHFNDNGYYCSGVECIEESYFGGGEYSPFLDSSTSPMVCGIVAVATGGGASGCVLVGWYDTFSNCFESDPSTCIGDFVIDEIAGRIFSHTFAPAAQGFARSLGRELTSEAAIDLFGTATNSGGIGNALTVVVGGTDTVYAPPLCEYSTCAPRILDHFANNP